MRTSWVARATSFAAFSGLLGLVVVACGDNTVNSQFQNDAGTNGQIDGSGGPPTGLGGEGGLTGVDGGVGSGTCASTTKRADVAQLDIILLVDSSGSMTANGKWQSLSQALTSFLIDPRATGIGIGLQYFPQFAGNDVVCDDNAYATPVIPIEPLDVGGIQASVIENSIMNRSPIGGTPMGPAVQGAVRFATTWQQSNPTHKVVTIVATDGLPDNSCQFVPAGRAANTIAGVQGVAADAFAKTPPVPTYVIGVGTELAPLNAVAASGGTTQAIIVDVTKDVTAQLVDALDQIRRTELACEYGIPVGDAANPVDINKVNVRFTDSLGYVDFLYVPGAAQCDQTDYGWYFDDNAHPTKILLCDPFCGEVKKSTLGTVDILLGCKREEAVIK
jgi:hypothetical protein